MAESFVQVAPDGTGKLLRTQTSVQGGNTVHEEVMVIADAAGNMVGTNTSAGSALQTVNAATGQFANSNLTSVLPGTSTSIQTNGTTTAGAQITASIPAVGGKTSYLMGFTAILGPGTAGTVQIAVTGTTNTLNFSATTVATTGNTILNIVFPYPVPASAVNTAVTVTVPATGGASAVNTVNAYGFQN